MKYLNIRGAIVSACWLVAAAAPASAASIIYTDRAAFNAATTGQVVDDFSGLGNGAGYPSIPGTGFTLTKSNALLISYDPNSSPNYEFNTGKVVEIASLNTSATGTFTLDPNVTAFGFDFGVLAGKNPSVTINGANYTAGGQPTFNFFGIVDSAGISPISLSFTASRLILDNVTVASAASVVVPPISGPVPEPATWAMVLVGFGIIGRALRHRERRSLRFV